MSSEISSDVTFTSRFGDNSHAGMQPLFGDFYAEPDDVMRSVTLPLRSSDADIGDGSKAMGSGEGSLLKQVQVHTPPDCSMWFESGYRAPALTDDIVAHLLITTLYLSETSPITVGNSLIAFFEQQVNARLNKVNKKKFTIRVEVLLDELHCEVKIRTYQHDRICVVEFQRRSGDTVAFNKLYRLVRMHVQMFESVEGLANTELRADIPPTNLPLDEAIALPPQLNLLELSSDVKLLSVAASDFAARADGPCIIERLRMPLVQSGPGEQEQAIERDIALPVSENQSRLHAR